MGLTLIEAAKYENRLEHLAVLKTFSEGEMLARLPFMNIAGSGLFYSAEQELPAVGFRAVNEGYSQSYGVVDQRAEAVHLFGGDVDVDRSIVDLMGPEARASQIEMKVRSMRLTLDATLSGGLKCWKNSSKVAKQIEELMAAKLEAVMLARERCATQIPGFVMESIQVARNQLNQGF